MKTKKILLWVLIGVLLAGVVSAADAPPAETTAGGSAYKLTENTTFDFSYRYLNMDYSNGSGSDKLALDVEAYGPVFGMTILF